jgi:hypothetical protein
LNRLKKVATILGLAYSAGRGRHDFIDPVGVGEPAEPRQGQQAILHGRVGERPTVESPRAQAHHLLLAIDDLE